MYLDETVDLKTFAIESCENVDASFEISKDGIFTVQIYAQGTGFLSDLNQPNSTIYYKDDGAVREMYFSGLGTYAFLVIEKDDKE